MSFWGYCRNYRIFDRLMDEEYDRLRGPRGLTRFAWDPKEHQALYEQAKRRALERARQHPKWDHTEDYFR